MKKNVLLFVTLVLILCSVPTRANIDCRLIEPSQKIWYKQPIIIIVVPNINLVDWNSIGMKDGQGKYWKMMDMDGLCGTKWGNNFDIPKRTDFPQKCPGLICGKNEDDIFGKDDNKPKYGHIPNSDCNIVSPPEKDAVAVVPAPGGVLLSAIGVSLVGWLRRQRTL